MDLLELNDVGDVIALVGVFVTVAGGVGGFLWKWFSKRPAFKVQAEEHSAAGLFKVRVTCTGSPGALAEFRMVPYQRTWLLRRPVDLTIRRWHASSSLPARLEASESWTAVYHIPVDHDTDVPEDLALEAVAIEAVSGRTFTTKVPTSSFQSHARAYRR